jgi:hypothetical protein
MPLDSRFWIHDIRRASSILYRESNSLLCLNLINEIESTDCCRTERRAAWFLYPR